MIFLLYVLLYLFCQVPLLSPSTIKWVQANTLVRFRGMVQDMLGNEFYVGTYKVYIHGVGVSLIALLDFSTYSKEG